jgi:ABC-type nitrate/sulfonate/bicarbonate transport system substrate-binding protein
MASIATSDALIARAPEAAAGAVRAIVKTQAALRRNVKLAGEVGRKVFPPDAAALITELIRRDLPFYDATISPEFVAGMNQFARDVGILQHDVRYGDVVAAQFKELWQRG